VTRRLGYVTFGMTVAFGITLALVSLRRPVAVADRLPPGSAVRLLAAEVGEFVHDVREGMREREHELRTSLGLGG